MNNYLKIGLVLILVLVTVMAAAHFFGLQSFTFEWVLNFMLMLGVSYFIQTYKPALKSSYYHTKKWENNGRIYQWFGINVFRKILVWVGWEKLNKASAPVQKNPAALKHLEYSTRQSELGHLIIFFIVFATTFFISFYYGLKQSLWLIILNVILNAYPIGVQRYNRPRLQRILSLSNNNPAAKNP